MTSLRHANIRCRVLDVTQDENVENTVRDIIQEAGKIDILVNNAGAMCIGLLSFFLVSSTSFTLISKGPAIEVDIKRALEVFDINFFGILRMARAIIPHMAAHKSGLVINVGSIVGET